MRRASPVERAESLGRERHFIEIQCTFPWKKKYRLCGDKPARLGREPV